MDEFQLYDLDGFSVCLGHLPFTNFDVALIERTNSNSTILNGLGQLQLEDLERYPH